MYWQKQSNNKNINNKKMNNKKQPLNKNNKPNLTWIYAAIAILFIIISVFWGNSNSAKEIGWKELIKLVQDKKIEKIVIINNETAEIYLTKEAKEKAKGKTQDQFSKYALGNSPDYYMTIGSVETFERRLEELQKGIPPEEQINLQYEKRENYFYNILSWLLPIIIFFAIWIFLFRKVSGGGGAGSQIFNVGKSKAKVFDKENKIKVDFNDVAGLEEAKIEIKEIVDFLKNPDKYTRLGGKIPKGVLLVGPPGTGKTLLARAVAGEADVPFFSLSGSDFVEMFVGVGASRVRDLFKQAKEKSPCIIFIDEIDAIGRARGRNVNIGGNDERESTLNQLLTEMDGFEPNSGIIVIAATNRADILDPALLRAGRFDRQIYLELPNLNERKEIFKVHTRKLKLAKDIDLEMLAKQTPGFSGADIANVCNEAALIAARKNKKEITREDFLAAIDRVIAGLEKRTKVITKKEKKTIAYHESGHAIVSWVLEHAHPLVKVSIVPRGRALGAAWYMPEERQITTYEQMLDEMCATLGGRASEELTFGTISTGALDDLERVSKKAYAIIAYFGMGENLKNVSYYDSTHQYEAFFSKPYSEKTAEEIDLEVKKLIETQYERAKKILRQYKANLEQLAQLLLEKEIIYAEDVERIMGMPKAKPENCEEEETKNTDEGKTSEENSSNSTNSTQEIKNYSQENQNKEDKEN
jgi:AFG3 family protein